MEKSITYKCLSCDSFHKKRIDILDTNIFCADESTVQVLKENRKKASSKSYMGHMYPVSMNINH